MTVSYKKSRRDGATYYVECMTLGEGTPVDDHYSGSGKEPPGVWFVGSSANGARSNSLGMVHGLAFNSIVGRSDTKRFITLAAGFNPETGQPLTQNAGHAGRIASHDYCLSSPKSVSSIWSQANEQLKSQIEAAQQAGSRVFLEFMSSKAYSRQGKAGVVKTPSALRGAIFGHGSSRADDPQLHDHNIVLNICERYDGTTGALETLEMMRWTGAAAALYHAQLAWGMRQLGLPVRRVGYLFEVEGVPAAVLDAFSQRRKEIVQAVRTDLVRLGLLPDADRASRAMFNKVAVESRNAKNQLTREQLQAIWQERGKALGFTQVEVQGLVTAAPIRELTRRELFEEARLAVTELTRINSLFREPALLCKVAARLVGQASPEQIQAAVEDVKVDLLTSRDAKDQVIFSTKQMVVVEREMLRHADRKDGRHVLKDLAEPQGLDAEHLAAWHAVTADVNAVSVVQGSSGAVKAFATTTLTRPYEARGYTVTRMVGEADGTLSRQDSVKLQDGCAIAGWILDVEKDRITLGPKDLLVVHQAQLVCSRDMARVLKLAKRHGAKVVLLGDRLEQNSVNAGDALRVIANYNGSSRFDLMRVQTCAQDRDAVLKFCDGKAKEGLAAYLARGDVHLASGQQAMHALLIAQWQASRQAHPDESHLILSPDKATVAALNRLAHQARRSAGELGDSGLFKTMDCTRKDQRVEISVGDDVVFRAAERRQRVYSRRFGTVERLQGEVLQVRTEQGLIEIDARDKKWQSQKHGGLALQHAYAISLASARDAARDRVFVADSPFLDRASAGVAMSRHRHGCQVFIDRQARYEAKMRETPADRRHPICEFSDEECLERVIRSWSSEQEKTSSLDFEDWYEAGARVDCAAELRILQLQDAKELARTNTERPRHAVTTKGGEAPLEAPPSRQIKSDTRCRDRSPVVAPSDADRTEPGPRERFAAMGGIDASRADVVRTGEEDAAALGSMQLGDGEPLSILGLNHKPSLGLSHVHPLTTEVKTLARPDLERGEGSSLDAQPTAEADKRLEEQESLQEQNKPERPR